MDTSKIRAAAEKATKGKRHVELYNTYSSIFIGDICLLGIEREQDLQFESLTDPDTVLELIAEIRLWKNRTDEAADAVAEFEDLQAENKRLLIDFNIEAESNEKLQAKIKALREALEKKNKEIDFLAEFLEKKIVRHNGGDA